MTTSLLARPVAIGTGQGEWPTRGSMAFAYDLDLTAGATTFDITNEIMSDQIDFIQCVYIDNADNSSRLDLTFAVTGQRISCPAYSQGVFTLLIPPGSIQVKAQGPAVKFHLLFHSMPLAPFINFFGPPPSPPVMTVLQNSALLGVGGTYQSIITPNPIIYGGVSFSQYSHLEVTVYADQAGTLFVEMGYFGYYPLLGSGGTAVAAGQTVTVRLPVAGANYIRIRYVNGMTPQGAFYLLANLVQS